MKFYQFVARKSFTSFKKSFTKTIIRLAITATALSIAVMILSLSIFNGFQKEISNKVLGFWGHIHITEIQAETHSDPVSIILNDSLLADISDLKMPGTDKTAIRHLQSFIVQPSILALDKQYDGVFIKGVGPDFDWDFFKSFLVKGELITTGTEDFSREILISEETSNRLNCNPGDKLILNFIVNGSVIKRKVLVSGIYNSGLAEYDRKWALSDINLLRNVLQKTKDEVTGIEVFCNNISEAESINEVLYQSVLPVNLYSETIRQKLPAIFEWLSLQDINKVFILCLILLVCIVNMCTILMILILERTHMIGVLMVLGMKTWDLRKIFLHYALSILGWSLFIGNLVGLGLCYIQEKFKIVKVSQADYYLSYAPIDIDLPFIFLLNIGIVCLILICLILPSWIVTTIKPINALKYR